MYTGTKRGVGVPETRKQNGYPCTLGGDELGPPADGLRKAKGTAWFTHPPGTSRVGGFPTCQSGVQEWARDSQDPGD